MAFEMKIDSKAFTFDQIRAFAVRKLYFNGIDEGTWMMASILCAMIVTKAFKPYVYILEQLHHKCDTFLCEDVRAFIAVAVHGIQRAGPSIILFRMKSIVMMRNNSGHNDVYE